MRILDIREQTVPVASAIANAYIDFSKMTLSHGAIRTGDRRAGGPVVGYGFNSNGRYGQGGLIRERFAPRLMEAEPKNLLNGAGDNFDPDRIWAALMKNEKPGGHGERSVAGGTIDMAVWDAGAKIAGEPLFRLLAERHRRQAEPRVFVYAAGGYYYPGKGIAQLRAEMRSYLDRGYTVVKMKIGNGIAEDRARLEGVLAELDGKAQLAVDANGRLPLEAPHPLRYGGMRPDRDWLQFDCALSYGLCEYQRTLAAVEAAGWSRRRLIPHGGHQMSLNIAAGLGLGGNENYPDLFQPFGGFPDDVRVEAGHIVMPELPGIGFDGKAALFKVMRQLAE